jgi:hypothetical protein
VLVSTQKKGDSRGNGSVVGISLSTGEIQPVEGERAQLGDRRGGILKAANTTTATPDGVVGEYGW